MRNKYIDTAEQIYDGELNPYDGGEILIYCCHCSLAHKWQFIFKDGKLHYKVSEDLRRTWHRRRKIGISSLMKQVREIIKNKVVDACEVKNE